MIFVGVPSYSARCDLVVPQRCVSDDIFRNCGIQYGWGSFYSSADFILSLEAKPNFYGVVHFPISIGSLNDVASCRNRKEPS